MSFNWTLKKKLYYPVCHRTEKGQNSMYNIRLYQFRNCWQTVWWNERVSTYDNLLVPDHALYPVHIFADTCIDARCRATTQSRPKACHTHYRICSGICSPHLQGSTRVTLKIRENNIISLTTPA